MQFTKVIIALSAAVMAYAGSEGGDAPGQVNASPCKNGQVQSCCNGDQTTAILGGNCFIPVISGQCTGNQFCCQATQDVSTPLSTLVPGHSSKLTHSIRASSTSATSACRSPLRCLFPTLRQHLGCSWGFFFFSSRA